MDTNRPSDMAERSQRLSYKFQRLRERLREAIETGVLSGKLPGERVLARQFRVNAKTLSKALTDLAAEGLLERTIGRGTFVRGQIEDKERTLGKWLLLCRTGGEASALCKALGEINPDSETLTDLATLRPSFLNGFTAVIDLHGELPELTLRDLILRSLRVILVDSLPKTYSTHSVLIDRRFCASMLARELIHDGYRHLYVVEETPGDIYEGVHNAARRLSEDAQVESIRPDRVGHGAAAGHGDVVYVCASMDLANTVRQTLQRAGVETPRQAGVVGIGIDVAGKDGGVLPCSGYVVSPDQVADAIRQLISEVQVHRPTPLWLVGAYVDRGTTRAKSGAAPRLAPVSV